MGENKGRTYTKEEVVEKILYELSKEFPGVEIGSIDMELNLDRCVYMLKEHKKGREIEDIIKTLPPELAY